jgi:uncharacterized protein YjbJ (UPF0337 family)
MTNQDIISGHWKELKGKLKQHWGKLTDDDITTLRGTYDEIEGLLQKRYGYTKQQTEKAIDEFIEKSGYKEKSF